MKKLTFLFIFNFILFSYQTAIAQEKNISGQVVVFDSIPVVGAIVVINSSKQTILTDSIGSFEALVQPKDKILISAKGFYSHKQKIEENKNLGKIDMKLKSGDRNADLAMENGHVTNVQTFMNARQLHDNKGVDFSQYATFFQLIEGRFPNVLVRDGEIIIRGDKSLTASSAALIVLDQVPTNFSVLSTLLPANIKSVEIVTGAPAMRYGPGSGNGALVIVTKGLAN